jgi:hypothetical protein
MKGKQSLLITNNINLAFSPCKSPGLTLSDLVFRSNDDGRWCMAMPRRRATCSPAGKHTRHVPLGKSIHIGSCRQAEHLWAGKAELRRYWWTLSFAMQAIQVSDSAEFLHFLNSANPTCSAYAR